MTAPRIRAVCWPTGTGGFVLGWTINGHPPPLAAMLGADVGFAPPSIVRARLAAMLAAPPCGQRERLRVIGDAQQTVREGWLVWHPDGEPTGVWWERPTVGWAPDSTSPVTQPPPVSYDWCYTAVVAVRGAPRPGSEADQLEEAIYWYLAAQGEPGPSVRLRWRPPAGVVTPSPAARRTMHLLATLHHREE